jgi:enamine deaminase RidA (YjgF/YER057c/UK114 family)
MTKLIKSLLSALLILSILIGSAYAEEVISDPEARLKELQITLPPVGVPKNHVEARRMGNIVYISGQVPADANLTGKISDDAQGLKEARTVGIALIAALKAEIGDLRKVKQIVKVNALINTADGANSVKIADAVSDLLVSIFGDRGKSARFVMGVSSNDTTMEADMIVEIEPISPKK